MSFKAYYKSKITNEVEVRECLRVDDREGVVWLKNGGWLLLENVYLTRERAGAHKHDTPSGSYRLGTCTSPRPEDER